MNKVQLIGRIAKDIELTQTTNGISVAKFSLAVDRKFKDANGEKVADFFNIVAWRTLGENIAKYCKKGSKIYIEGELQNRTYDASDGTKKYITEIIANECEFLDSKQTPTEQSEKEETTKAPAEDDTLPF